MSVGDAFVIFAAVFSVCTMVYCWHVDRKTKRIYDEIERRRR